MKNESKDLPTVNVIITGHIDHGKTTLLQKITGIWTDTHSEELKRGITIKLGYADKIIYQDDKNYNIEGKGKPIRYVSFLDAPGHEMLMATMLSGAAIVDAAILVVAANEGIKPQTYEHFMALQAKKIKNIIIVQNKIDLVNKEQALANYKIIKQLVKGTIAENAPIIPVSAKQEININRIYEALCKVQVPDRNEKADPIFFVARSFDVNKPGTKPQDLQGAVLGGTLKQGALKIGDEIEIKPGTTIKEANQVKYKTLKTKVKALFKGRESVKEIVPGGSLAIETELDMSLSKTDHLSGCVISKVGVLPEITSHLKISHTLFDEVNLASSKQKIDPIKLSETLMLSINTSVTVGIVKKITGNDLEISLKIPIIPFAGDNVGIARNINSHWRLIGFGEIK